MIRTRIPSPFVAVAASLLCLAWAAPSAAQPRQLGPPSGLDLEGSNESSETSGTPIEKGEKKEVNPILDPQPAATKPIIQRRAKVDTDVLDIPLEQIPNYRGVMRDIVEEMSRYARGRNPKFAILARPGFDMLFWGQREFDLEEIKRDPMRPAPADTIKPVGMPMRRYIQAIDGVVIDGQLCSPLRVPRADLAAARKEGLKIAVVDHCLSDSMAVAALQSAAGQGMLAMVEGGQDPQFTTVPKRRPIPENPANVESLSAARNMLMLLSAKSFGSRAEWLTAMGANNYDVVVIDAFDRVDQPLNKDEIHSLKFKQVGARRLVFARLDIGHADDSRYYWQRDWDVGKPSWIIALNPEVPGQYIVEFWNPAWKAIIGKYFAGILDLGFDGVVLDGVEAYRRWEIKTPVNLGK